MEHVASNNKKNRKYYLAAGGAAAIIVVIVLLLILTGEEPVYTFEELCPIAAGEVQELSMRDGATGDLAAVGEPEAAEAAADFLEIMAPLTFREDKDPPRPGWSYTVDLFRGEEDYLRAVFAGQSVQLIRYEDGREEWDKRFTADEDVTSQLEELYVQVREIQEEKEKPTEVAVEEIHASICVVINNHPSARPSSGLQKADTIYEFLVEGGSTRYLAVFRSYYRENFDIGPIRSLRPYFGVQSAEYGGIVAHSGYSARTRQMIAGLGLYQIADYGNNFWRDPSRRAPHNLYTSIDRLYSIADDRIETEERFYSLEYELPDGAEKAETIEIEYSPHNRVRYTYDPEEERYFRAINGQPHSDRETGEHYHAYRVIIRQTPHTSVPGSEGLVDIDLHGSGPGFLYEKGHRYPITWERNGQETVYRFDNGEEIPPTHRTTWIQVTRR